jgi:hypothetical protein
MARKEDTDTINPEFLATQPEQFPDMMRLMFEMTEFQRSTHDLEGKDADPLTLTVLAVIATYEDAGSTAADIAFYFELPVRTVNSKLKRLMKAGVIAKDGDRYRYTPTRPLTPDEERKFHELQREIEKLRPAFEQSRQHDA